MKVSKKDEKMARALCMDGLIGCGFPEERRDIQVDRNWHECLDQAVMVNMILRYSNFIVLDGDSDVPRQRRSTQ